MCVCSLSAFRVAAHGKGRGGSVLFVVMVLAWFPVGVEGGACSYSPRTGDPSNVKAENMAACETCEASCSSTVACETGCAQFYGKYPSLTSCKARCVRRQINRHQCDPAVWCCVCRKRGVWGGWRGILMFASNSHTPCLRWRTALNGHIGYCVTMTILNHVWSTFTMIRTEYTGKSLVVQYSRQRAIGEHIGTGKRRGECSQRLHVLRVFMLTAHLWRGGCVFAAYGRGSLHPFTLLTSRCI